MNELGELFLLLRLKHSIGILPVESREIFYRRFNCGAEDGTLWIVRELVEVIEKAFQNLS